MMHRARLRIPVTRSVVFSAEARIQMRRYILPGTVTLGGRLLVPGPYGTAPDRRQRLLDDILAILTADPQATGLGTVRSERQHPAGPVHVSMLKDVCETLHLWWAWAGDDSAIQVLDLTFTASLTPEFS